MMPKGKAPRPPAVPPSGEDEAHGASGDDATLVVRSPYETDGTANVTRFMYPDAAGPPPSGVAPPSSRGAPPSSRGAPPSSGFGPPSSFTPGAAFAPPGTFTPGAAFAPPGTFTPGAAFAPPGTFTPGAAFAPPGSFTPGAAFAPPGAYPPPALAHPPATGPTASQSGAHVAIPEAPPNAPAARALPWWVLPYVIGCLALAAAGAGVLWLQSRFLGHF